MSQVVLDDYGTMDKPCWRPSVTAGIEDDRQDGESDCDERRNGAGQDELVAQLGDGDDEDQQEGGEGETADDVLEDK